GAGVAERVLVSSFDPLLLARFRLAARGVATGLLFHADMSAPLRRGWAAAVLAPAAVHPESKLVTPRTVEAWHRRGYAVHVWTVDDPHEIAFLDALGCDAVITNRPTTARRIVREPPAPARDVARRA